MYPFSEKFLHHRINSWDKLIAASLRHMVTYIWVDIGSGRGLLSCDTKHHLNQCWLLICEVSWHSPERVIYSDGLFTILYNKLEDYIDLLSTRFIGINFSEILFKIWWFLFKKMLLKMLSVIMQPNFMPHALMLKHEYSGITRTISWPQLSDDLILHIAMPSTTMVLSIQGKQFFANEEDGFQLPTTWEIIENANINLVLSSFKSIQNDKVNPLLLSDVTGQHSILPWMGNKPSGDGLLPDGIKLLPKPMLTHHQ